MRIALSKLVSESGAFAKFKIRSDTPLTFADIQKHDTLKKRKGPHTVVIDVSEEPSIKKAPADNKWNAIKRLYGNDNDEIACASFAGGKEWYCGSINIEV